MESAGNFGNPIMEIAGKTQQFCFPHNFGTICARDLIQIVTCSFPPEDYGDAIRSSLACSGEKLWGKNLSYFAGTKLVMFFPFFSLPIRRSSNLKTFRERARRALQGSGVPE